MSDSAVCAWSQGQFARRNSTTASARSRTPSEGAMPSDAVASDGCVVLCSPAFTISGSGRSGMGCQRGVVFRTLGEKSRHHGPPRRELLPLDRGVGTFLPMVRPDDPRARAWVEVDAGALRANLAHIRAAAGDSAAVIPMVKANAYGLGVRETVAVLETDEPGGYGVATVEEGLEVRALGVRRPVLVMTPPPASSLPAAVDAGLTL
ncbi:MAG: hypothetical protein F4X47_06625, partial [Gammaproteobacteria bacterium]|nr:hypothetical protein [Gammaproteobacteria bacterium]